jgi:hypothetical protein
MTFGKQILKFFDALQFPFELKNEVEVMNPFSESSTIAACKQFYNKYYNDNRRRRMIIGINPGRFGGGVTGIPFTDPIRLANECNIPNNWPKKQELSSLFIYQMITAYGGPELFYQNFYITSVSPLGFIRYGKNLNYYDDKTLETEIKDFVIDGMNKQLQFGIHRDIAFCLGDGKNFKYLNRINDENKFFKKIIPLSHPRFIMQYKLKKKEEYISYYLKQLSINN